MDWSSDLKNLFTNRQQQNIYQKTGEMDVNGDGKTDYKDLNSLKKDEKNLFAKSNFLDINADDKFDYNDLISLSTKSKDIDGDGEVSEEEKSFFDDIIGKVYEKLANNINKDKDLTIVDALEFEDDISKLSNEQKEVIGESVEKLQNRMISNLTSQFFVTNETQEYKDNAATEALKIWNAQETLEESKKGENNPFNSKFENLLDKLDKRVTRTLSESHTDTQIENFKKTKDVKELDKTTGSTGSTGETGGTGGTGGSTPDVTKLWDEVNGTLYKNGEVYTGLYKNRYYKNGKLANGEYQGNYYEFGSICDGLSDFTGDFYKNGKLAATGDYDHVVVNSGVSSVVGKFHVENGVIKYEDTIKDNVLTRTEFVKYAYKIPETDVTVPAVKSVETTYVGENASSKVAQRITYKGDSSQTIEKTETYTYNEDGTYTCETIDEALNRTVKKYDADGNEFSGNGVFNGHYYENGELATGECGGKYYVAGDPANGDYNGFYYKSGLKYTGDRSGTMYHEGIVANHVVVEGKYYVTGKLHTGRVTSANDEGAVFTEYQEGVVKSLTQIYSSTSSELYSATTTYRPDGKKESYVTYSRDSKVVTTTSYDANESVFEIKTETSDDNNMKTVVIKDGNNIEKSYLVYQNDVLYSGRFGGMVFDKGAKFTGKYTDNIYYSKGLPANDVVVEGKYCISGSPVLGVYGGKYYEVGVENKSIPAPVISILEGMTVKGLTVTATGFTCTEILNNIEREVSYTYTSAETYTKTTNLSATIQQIDAFSDGELTSTKIKFGSTEVELPINNALSSDTIDHSVTFVDIDGTTSQLEVSYALNDNISMATAYNINGTVAVQQIVFGTINEIQSGKVLKAYTVQNPEKVTYTVNNENGNITITDTFADGITVTQTFDKDGKLIEGTVNVSSVTPNIEVTLEKDDSCKVNADGTVVVTNVEGDSVTITSYNKDGVVPDSTQTGISKQALKEFATKFDIEMADMTAIVVDEATNKITSFKMNNKDYTVTYNGDITKIASGANEERRIKKVGDNYVEIYTKSLSYGTTVTEIERFDNGNEKSYATYNGTTLVSKREKDENGNIIKITNVRDGVTTVQSFENNVKTKEEVTGAEGIKTTKFFNADGTINKTVVVNGNTTTEYTGDKDNGGKKSSETKITSTGKTVTTFNINEKVATVTTYVGEKITSVVKNTYNGDEATPITVTTETYTDGVITKSETKTNGKVVESIEYNAGEMAKKTTTAYSEGKKSSETVTTYNADGTYTAVTKTFATDGTTVTKLETVKFNENKVETERTTRTNCENGTYNVVTVKDGKTSTKYYTSNDKEITNDELKMANSLGLIILTKDVNADGKTTKITGTRYDNKQAVYTNITVENGKMSYTETLTLAVNGAGTDDDVVLSTIVEKDQQKSAKLKLGNDDVCDIEVNGSAINNLLDSSVTTAEADNHALSVVVSDVLYDGLVRQRVYTKGSDGKYAKTENIAVGTIETINNDSVKFAIPEGTEYSFDKQAKQLTFTKLKDNKLTINGHERTFAANETLVLTLNSTTTPYSVKSLVGTVEKTENEKLIKKVRTYDIETGEIKSEEIFENNVSAGNVSYEYDANGKVKKSTENFDDHEIVTEFSKDTKTVTTNNFTKDKDGKITETKIVSKITYKVEAGKADVKQSEVDYSGLETKTISYVYYENGKLKTKTTRLGDNNADGKLLEVVNYSNDENNTVKDSEKHIYESTKDTIVTTKDVYSTAEIKDNNKRTAWGLAFGDKIVELPNSADITDIRTIATLSTNKKEINVIINASNNLPKFTLQYANEATATCAVGDLISGKMEGSGKKVTLNPGSTFMTFNGYVVVKNKAQDNSDLISIYDSTLNNVKDAPGSPLANMNGNNLLKLMNALSSFKATKGIDVNLNNLTAVTFNPLTVTVKNDASHIKYAINMNDEGVVTGYKKTDINANWEITKDYTGTTAPNTMQIKVGNKDIGSSYPLNTTIALDENENVIVSYTTDSGAMISATYSIKEGVASADSCTAKIKDKTYNIPEGSEISIKDGILTVTKTMKNNSSLTLNYKLDDGTYNGGLLKIANSEITLSSDPGQVVISESAISFIKDNVETRYSLSSAYGGIPLRITGSMRVDNFINNLIVENQMKSGEEPVKEGDDGFIATNMITADKIIAVYNSTKDSNNEDDKELKAILLYLVNLNCSGEAISINEANFQNFFGETIKEVVIKDGDEEKTIKAVLKDDMQYTATTTITVDNIYDLIIKKPETTTEGA